MPHLPPLRLPVAGLTPMTSLDYPRHLSCVVFLQGCPLACGYCHNPQMLAPRRGSQEEWARILDFLMLRRGLLEAVVFSGGEPTLHPGLATAIDQVRERGFKVGLHTAGAYPERLSQLLPTLDWVGFDVKGHGRDIDRICGRPDIWRRQSHSLAALLESGRDFECRTTVHWRDFDLAKVERLALSLADLGVRHYALQVARTGQCLDPAYAMPLPDAPSHAALEALVRRLRPYFAHLELRQ